MVELGEEEAKLLVALIHGAFANGSIQGENAVSFARRLLFIEEKLRAASTTSRIVLEAQQEVAPANGKRVESGA